MAALGEVLIQRALDAAVTRALKESPRARELLAALNTRRLAIEVSGLPFNTTVESTGSALRASRALSGAAHDAKITGAPISLLALGGADAQAVIQRGDVRIEGDAEIAQQFRELAQLLKPDLETLFGELFGRSAAHLLMRGLRGAAAWTRSSAWTGVQNLSEYLAHERGELVSRAEAEHFLRGVDDMREQLDRIAARAAQLEQKWPAPAAPKERS
jgi:ubiquinone biosynthesis accessory factor UbiJ